MSAEDSNGPELLRGEILSEAHRQRDDILGRAQDAADQLVGRAQQEAEQARQEKLEAARTQASRRQEAILATVAVETGRMRLARIEELLQGIYEQTLKRLRNADAGTRRTTLAGLATEALTRMTGNDFVLKVSSDDLQVLGNGVVDEVRRRWARPWLTLRLEEDPRVRAGSWVLQDEAGRQLWDLGLEARLQRVWPQLRRQIALHAGFVELEQRKGAP